MASCKYALNHEGVFSDERPFQKPAEVSMALVRGSVEKPRQTSNTSRGTANQDPIVALVLLEQIKRHALPALCDRNYRRTNGNGVERT